MICGGGRRISVQRCCYVRMIGGSLVLEVLVEVVVLMVMLVVLLLLMLVAVVVMVVVMMLLMMMQLGGINGFGAHV